MGKSALRALVEGHRRLVAVHGRRIVEALDLRIILVDAQGPRTRPIAPARAHRHGGSGPGGPRAGEVEKGDRAGQLEGHQPRAAPRALDGPGVLEDLGEAGVYAQGAVEDPAGLLPGRGRMRVEAHVRHRAPVPEAVPRAGVCSAPVVHPPDDRPSTQALDLRGEAGREPPPRRRSGELRHYNAAASSAALSGGCPPRSHRRGVSGRSSSSRVHKSELGLPNHRATARGPMADGSLLTTTSTPGTSPSARNWKAGKSHVLPSLRP